MGKALAALSQLRRILGEFRRADDGAALIEYTVLLGMLLVAAFATIWAVGTWINGVCDDAKQPRVRSRNVAVRVV